MESGAVTAHARLHGAVLRRPPQEDALSPDSGSLMVSSVRATRVLYVEDDPALRGIIVALLLARPDVEVVGSYSSSVEVLAEFRAIGADVALLDLDLGPESLSGIELGLILRERNPNLGIVMLTQHVVPDFLTSLPMDVQWGWSFLEKRGDMDLDVLVDVLRSTARGLNVLDPGVQRAREAAGPSPINSLSKRQREILALAAVGMDATAIANELGLAAVSVRQELSKAYLILVPDPKPGTDLRTSAVLRYLRETRVYSTALDV